MRKVPDQPARTVLGDALKPLLPEGWQLIEHEAIADDSDRTRVRLAQRTIVHSTTGYSADHILTFAATVTVPTESLDAAETQLDDEMETFLYALDAADIPWERAEKGRFADENNRLGYSLDITIRTERSEK